MKYCIQCGRAVPDEARFCGNCGADLGGPSAETGGTPPNPTGAGTRLPGTEDWRTVVPTGGTEMAGGSYAVDSAGTYRQTYTVPGGGISGGAGGTGSAGGGTGTAVYNPAASVGSGENTYRQTYTLPRPAADAAAVSAARRKVPVYDRGVFSPKQPGGRRALVNVLLVLALAALQVGLTVVFSGFAEGTEAGPLVSQVVGLVPVLLLLMYIYCLDTIEKEPVRLLLKLFLAEGMVAMTAVMLAETVLDDFFFDYFGEYADTIPSRLFYAFFLVALVEELGKYAVLRGCTWKHPAFNYRFDGIVYAAVTALGFAAFENVGYVRIFGLGTALVRSISAVPGHCVDGILMGIFYGQARCYAARGEKGRSLLFRVLSVAAPVLEHGFYDFVAGIENEAVSAAFMLYVWVLNAVVFVAVWRLSQKDEAVSA